MADDFEFLQMVGPTLDDPAIDNRFISLLQSSKFSACEERMASSTPKPWHDWIPGVLSRRQVEKLAHPHCGLLRDFILDHSDHSSIDLHLSAEGYELTKGSVKPSDANYLQGLQHADLVEKLEPDSSGHFLLRARSTYLFKLVETFWASKLCESPIHGQATAKSSVGRVDVLARLIVDGMRSYEEFSPQDAGKGIGEMFLEITPMTFDVVVKQGISLTQLRFFCDEPRAAEISGETVYKTLIKDGDHPEDSLSVDLTNDKVGRLEVAAFRAREGTKPIRLWEEAPLAAPWDYWCFEQAEVHPPDKHLRLRIKPKHFYILRSKERIAVPPGVAVYCRAIDETIGEIRIHYAGFAHPFFGRERSDDTVGTPLIFEVRGHDIEVNLRHGEKLARLVFYRMSEDASQEKSEASEKKPYADQRLQLSKFFDKWPEALVLGENGSVQPPGGK